LRPDELATYLGWFRTLPIWLDLDGLRVVHACWDDQAIKKITLGLQKHGGVSKTLQSAGKGKSLDVAVDVVLKGKEAALPDGKSFQNKDGNVRTEIRTRWYSSPEGHTHGTYALQSDAIDCDLELTTSKRPHRTRRPPSPFSSATTGFRLTGPRPLRTTWPASITV